MKIEYNYSKELGEFLSRQGVEEALDNQKKAILDELDEMVVSLNLTYEDIIDLIKKS